MELCWTSYVHRIDWAYTVSLHFLFALPEFWCGWRVGLSSFCSIQIVSYHSCHDGFSYWNCAPKQTHSPFVVFGHGVLLQQHTVTNTRCTQPVVPTPLKVFLFIPFTRGFQALNGWKQLHLLRAASKGLNQANGAPKDDVRNKPKWKTLGKPFLFAGHFPPQTSPLIVGTFRNHKSSL